MKTRILLLAGACLLAVQTASAADDPAATVDNKPLNLLSGSTAEKPAAKPARPAAVPDANPAVNQALRPIEAEEAPPTEVSAKGANSFTEAQARKRMQDHGYNVVGNLLKDGNGVWHAEVTKGAAKESTMVALDFKGNLLEEQAYTNHPTTPLRIAPSSQSGSTQPAPAKPIDGAP